MIYENDEWFVMRSLAEDCSTAIKPAGKVSCAVILDMKDYLGKAENHLKDSFIYDKETKVSNKDLAKLVDERNQIFKNLLNNKRISTEEFKYFSYNFKKATNLDKLNLLPKIHKRLHNIPSLSCNLLNLIWETEDFLYKLKSPGKAPDNSILVTADIVGLYPSISQKDGLNALSAKLEEH